MHCFKKFLSLHGLFHQVREEHIRNCVSVMEEKVQVDSFLMLMLSPVSKTFNSFNSVS